MTTLSEAIYYHPEGFNDGQPVLLGRHAATAALLRAVLADATEVPLLCVTHSPKHFDHLRSSTQADSRRQVAHVSVSDPRKLLGCVYFRPDPMLSRDAWVRHAVGTRNHSICGLTHALASANVVEGVAAHVTAPLFPWDGLICTSACIQRVASEIQTTWRGWLADRLGSCNAPAIRLARIPLGVHAEDFDPGLRETVGRPLRYRLSILDDEVVIAYVGRLNSRGKANLASMLISVGAASERTKRKIVLLVAGWFADDAEKLAFEGALWMARAARVVWVDGREPELRRNVWYASDIFLSLVDNIQESFGLTPVEAMAAGLPVVVSDWDGYQDTIEDGLVGYRIPAWMPPGGAGEAIAWRYLTGLDDYITYVGRMSLEAAVDVPRAADAIARLVDDEPLRIAMGRAGRDRAVQTFAWPNVLAQYRAFWMELDQERRSSPSDSVRANPAHPLFADPARRYSAFGRQLKKDVRLSLGAASEFDRLVESPLCSPFGRASVDRSMARAIAAAFFGTGHRTVEEVAAEIADLRTPEGWRTLLWLVKFDVLRVV